ncbi:MAG: hypothetical protein WBP26_04730 [Candidatus Saccharimonadales bacterium]
MQESYMGSNVDMSADTVRRMAHAPDTDMSLPVLFPHRRWLIGAALVGVTMGLGADSTPRQFDMAEQAVEMAVTGDLLPSIAPNTPLQITVPPSSAPLSPVSTLESPAGSSLSMQSAEQTAPAEVPLQFVELAPSPPTHMWFYKRTESGLLDPIPYLDTAITQNPEATIIKGYTDIGRPIVQFVPGCLRSVEGACVEEDYDAVNNMTLYGDPTSEPNPVELRNKSGVRIGLHTSNDPNKYRKGSDLHKAAAGDVQIVQTANGYFVYSLTEANTVLKDAVASDPRFNGPENADQSKIISFTCVSSNADTIALENQENYFTVGTMLGGLAEFPDLSKL